MDIDIPGNLGLFVGYTDGRAEVIEKMLRGRTDLLQNLLELGRYWKIKVWFKEPVKINIPLRRTKVEETDGWTRWHYNVPQIETTEHVFSHLGITDSGMLIYTPSKRVRKGWAFPSLGLIAKYEPVLEKDDTFRTYEDFKAKFDPLFISESEILKLWNGKSSQHGGKYKPSDFKRFSHEGRKVMEQFLRSFTGFDKTEEYKYIKSKYGAHLDATHVCYSGSNLGRDLKISHAFGRQYVHYSSEFPGCGNGSYGLVANKSTYLHLEDD